MPIKPVTKKVKVEKPAKTAPTKSAKSDNKRTGRKLPVANLLTKMHDLTKQIMTS